MTKRKPPQPSLTFRVLRGALSLLLLGLFAVTATVLALYLYLEPRLPDIEILKDVRYQIPMGVYSRDGKLIGQFGEKKRSPISIDEVPEPVVRAFLAAEDDRFFDHPGVDYQGLLRAAFEFLRTGEKRQGGSTITMQVARNFFLSSEKTMLRKLNEILLAVKIESSLPKRQILELYLNKIYFGQHAYGIMAAAQIYYGKSVKELSLSEIAVIAGLPKAPSSYNPISDPSRALERRNYVLQRMLKLHYITESSYQEAVSEPVTARLHTQPVELRAPYLAEMVRNELVRQYGENAYLNGYQVYTTLDSRLQVLGEKALRSTLHEYDQRHGYRGAKLRVDMRKAKTDADWERVFEKLPPGGETVPGLVVAVKEKSATVYVAETGLADLGWETMKWARRYISEDSKGAWPKAPKDILKPGDVIRLRPTETGNWALSQLPEVAGSLVALDPSDGAILALVGGYDFALSKFNRATQAQRQPGSGFKPFLYAAALENGFTPGSIIMDAPVAYHDPSMEGGTWRPQNYSGKFYGPTRLRVALAKSRNLVSVRLLREVGLNKVIDMANRFGFTPDELPRSLSLALGTGYASPVRMAQAYAVFSNGGFRVDPYFINRIETLDGKVVFEARPKVACRDCIPESAAPVSTAERVLSPQVHYMMNSMLQDVIRTGTATSALQLSRSDIAGKTGTTNDYRDAWFNGYTPNLVTVCWMGFDSFKSLGKKETGGHAALSMWIAFMKEALSGVPEIEFPQPEGLTTVRIDKGSGLLAPADNERTTLEVFPSENTPKRYAAPRPTQESADLEGTLEDLSPADTTASKTRSESARKAAPSPSIESLF